MIESDKDEIKKLRREISQKQRRENKMAWEIKYYKGKAYRAEFQLEAMRAMIQSLGLPRQELAELGRELLATFGDKP